MSTLARAAAARVRVERVEERDGIRYRLIEQPRVRYAPKPISRMRTPLAPADPEPLLTRLDRDEARMAMRVLREGGRGWRRWSTLRRHSGRDFSPILAEGELLERLVREAGLLVEDRFREGRWRPNRFRVDESVWPWLGIVDPDVLRAELDGELTVESLRAALADGPPRGMDWPSFAFVLRAGERLSDLAEHGVRPGARELAGQIDHTKAWTDRRRGLLDRLLERPFQELVAKYDRIVELRGALSHGEGDLWASQIDEVELSLAGLLRGVILVENRETFRHLLDLAELDYLVLWVPGGPPPAEVSLVRRLAELQPELRFHAVFDLDPAGIRIARLVEERAGVALEPTGMTPELFASARKRLALNRWDEGQLERYAGDAAALEPLRAVITVAGAKVEQETIQRRLYSLFAALA
ncbi:MAG: DUF2399 domain-containing protein [Gaiellaceae bacterium]